MLAKDGLALQIPQQKLKRPFDPELTSETFQSSTKQLKASSGRQKNHNYPPSFWDNLSQQWLTRRALREFDRRTCSLPPPPPPQSHCEDLQKVAAARLKRFARQGGPDLEDLRSYPEPKNLDQSPLISSSQSSLQKSKSQIASQSSNMSFTKNSRISAYDKAFEQHLRDHGIYPSGFNSDEDMEPHNLDEIKKRLSLPRASLSLSKFGKDDFRKFVRENDRAKNEAGVMSDVFPLIIGKKDVPSQQMVEFTRLAPLTDGSIVKAKPDFYDGTKPSAGNRILREELGSFIVPAAHTSGPCLPNFFAEAKGPDGSSAVVTLQACYDGAHGARGMHQVRSYANVDDPFDNNAYTITATYAGGLGGGHLTLYSTHPTSSVNRENPIEYHMTRLRGFDMTDSPETFREGATALRNARDWAREERDEVIAAANKRGNQ